MIRPSVLLPIALCAVQPAAPALGQSAHPVRAAGRLEIMPIEWTMPTAASVDDSHPVARPLAIAYPSEESNAIHFEFRGARF